MLRTARSWMLVMMLFWFVFGFISPAPWPQVFVSVLVFGVIGFFLGCLYWLVFGKKPI